MLSEIVLNGRQVGMLSAMAIVESAGTGKKPSKEDQPAAASMDPLLLASAGVGSWEALNVLLKREAAKNPPMVIPTVEFLELLGTGSSAQGRVTARDVEVGAIDHPPAAAASLAAGTLLRGITPDGDTALHVVARNHKQGGQQHFLKFAGIVYDKERGLLFAKNHRGDTPLHCAAQARNFEMASHLIDLAGREGAHRKLELLRMENQRHETALHEAVRFEDGRDLGPKDREAMLGDDGAPEERVRVFVEESSIVDLLMGADPQLANYPADGISPFYLAIFLKKSTIAVIMYAKSGGNLSYSGADGQNALHLAAFRDADTVMMELLLHWNKSLTTQVDIDGSTPLHFASSMPYCEALGRLLKLFKANPAALYQADSKGFFPIHVALSVSTIRFFLGENPASAGLRDAEGKTFLHVAIEKQILGIVSYVCGEASLAWILNMQDNGGNTAMHLAILGGNFKMFCALFGNRDVDLSLTNNQGETPRDVSRSMIPRGMSYSGNPEEEILHALCSVGTITSALRSDKAEEKFFRHLIMPGDQDKESQNLKDATQSFIVSSVLIATMAFGATFAIPGGCRGDDHKNGGTPTLAGRYIFDAFMMANTLAFVCSLIATTGFMLAGSPMVNLFTRKIYLTRSERFFLISVTCMSTAFALGVYMVLAPVARSTAIVICVITLAILVGKDFGFLCVLVNLTRPLLIRKGRFHGIVFLLRWYIFSRDNEIWVFLVTFGWAALARIYHRH